MSASGVLTFGTPSQNVYTCESVRLDWTYEVASGTPEFDNTMRLTINEFRSPLNDEIVDRNAAVPPPEDIEGRVVKTLAEDIPLLDSSFLWNQVDIPGGRYHITGRTLGENPLYAVSRSFEIFNGTDMSCLDNDSDTDTDTGTPTGSPSSDVTSTPPPPTTDGDSQPTVDPETGSATSSSTTNTGAIAGGVVAGVVALLAALLIAFLCRRRNRKRDHARRSQHGYLTSRSGAGQHDDDKYGGASSISAGRKGPSRWMGLGSVDLKFSGSGKEAAASAGNDPRSSMNALRGNALGLTALNREPGAASPTDYDDAKYPLGGESASSLGHGILKNAEYDTAFAAYAPAPDHDRNRALSQPSPPSLPTSPISPAESRPSHRPTKSLQATSTDVSNGSVPRRKAPRKPVPAYSSGGTEPVAIGASQGSLPSLTTASSSYGSTAPISSPEDYKTQMSPQLERSLTAMGLGGKEMHYIMPDMPMGYQRSQGYGNQGAGGEDWQGGRR